MNEKVTYKFKNILTMFIHFFRFKKKYYAKTANLLTGETAATLEEQAKAAEGN